MAEATLSLKLLGAQQVLQELRDVNAQVQQIMATAGASPDPGGGAAAGIPSVQTASPSGGGPPASNQMPAGPGVSVSVISNAGATAGTPNAATYVNVTQQGGNAQVPPSQVAPQPAPGALGNMTLTQFLLGQQMMQSYMQVATGYASALGASQASGVPIPSGAFTPLMFQMGATALGATIGSVFPGVGTMVGAGIGSAVGQIGGSYLMESRRPIALQEELQRLTGSAPKNLTTGMYEALLHEAQQGRLVPSSFARNLVSYETDAPGSEFAWVDDGEKIQHRGIFKKEFGGQAITAYSRMMYSQANILNGRFRMDKAPNAFDTLRDIEEYGYDNPLEAISMLNMMEKVSFGFVSPDRVKARMQQRLQDKTGFDSRQKLYSSRGMYAASRGDVTSMVYSEQSAAEEQYREAMGIPNDPARREAEMLSASARYNNAQSLLFDEQDRIAEAKYGYHSAASQYELEGQILGGSRNPNFGLMWGSDAEAYTQRKRSLEDRARYTGMPINEADRADLDRMRVGVLAKQRQAALVEQDFRVRISKADSAGRMADQYSSSASTIAFGSITDSTNAQSDLQLSTQQEIVRQLKEELAIRKDLDAASRTMLGAELKRAEATAKVLEVQKAVAAIDAQAAMGHFAANEMAHDLQMKRLVGKNGLGLQEEELSVAGQRLKVEEDSYQQKVDAGVDPNKSAMLAQRERIMGLREQKQIVDNFRATVHRTDAELAQGLREDTMMDFARAGYGSSGMLRQLIGQKLSSLGKDQKTDDANRQKQLDDGSWNDAKEKTFAMAQTQRAREALALQQEYDEGGLDRVISEAHNIGSRGHMAMTQFTHRETAFYGIRNRLFGGTQADSEAYRREGPARVLSIMGTGSQQGFKEHAAADGMMRQHIEVEVTVKAKDESGKPLEATAKTIRDLPTADTVRRNPYPNKSS